MNKSELQLTSVKVHRNLFEEFKIECVKTKFSFQKLSDRAIYLYLTNEEFKKTIHNQTNLQLNK
jgi:predicted house-cleaning NTP pyrophosphatase (Maf/HAM1 superfamily)|tara:strand:+ start:313 stop:504 length:192 start_codon:yes stop_codon:yes gene_type:complete